eukprot:366417-Chlamydomonas_euryale.AAC.27
MFLEDEGRFSEAEAEFISANKPKEAIDMYMHAQDWDAAMRIAEQYDPAAVSEVHVAQARAAAERKQFQSAESLYLLAKRPELALKMFREQKMWHDAMRIAEDYLPGKVAEIQVEMASGGPAGPTPDGGANADAVIAQARKYEAGNDYARAIEAYLSLSPKDSPNVDTLESCWMQAANLAMNYQRHRMHDVIAAVSGKLCSSKRHASAGELHESIDDVQGAIRVFCAGGLFDRARALAGNNPTFNTYIQEQYNKHLVSNEAAEEMAAQGGSMGQQALEMYVQRNDWDKVHEAAAQQGADVAALYASKHAERLFKQGEYGTAASVLGAHGAVVAPAYIELYRGIAMGVLGAASHERSRAAEAGLKAMMFKLVSKMGSSTAVSANVVAEFRKMYLAAHYTALANEATQAGLKDLAAMQKTATLRYAGIIPADRVFYEAGMAWRNAGRPNMAFVMLNRFLDLCDAMDEPDTSAAMIENADYANTDIPFDFTIPQRPYVGEAEKEGVRDYILELSMDQTVEQVLSTRRCEQCGSETYEANLTCHSCKATLEPCSVSGYPTASYDKVVSTQNGLDVVAIRENWNLWATTFNSCPVTGGGASPMY